MTQSVPREPLPLVSFLRFGGGSVLRQHVGQFSVGVNTYCIEGANACPPEYVGGGPGYYEFLEAMANPNHPEHEAMVEWHGDVCDPAVFECERVISGLNGLRLELQGGVVRTLTVNPQPQAVI